MSLGNAIIDVADDILVATLVDINLNGQVYRISNAGNPLTVDGDFYRDLGTMLDVGPIQQNYGGNTPDVNITISGIPNDYNYTNIVLNQPIKGGEVAVYRLFMLASNHSVQETQTSFTGVINSYALEEDWSYSDSTYTQSLVLSCTPTVQYLLTQVRGQRTSPVDRKRIYGNTDVTFDRVSSSRGG